MVPLAAGHRVAGGRYELRARYGADHGSGVEFWRGRDERLARDVALTVLTRCRCDDSMAAARQRALEHARHAGMLDDPAIARILDVLGPTQLDQDVAGLVVATWTPGPELLVAARHLSLAPAGVCRIVRPLAAAVGHAHRLGLAIGVDCPQRILLTEQHTLTLAFPGPKPATTTEDDVRGLAALVCLLLTGTWPEPNDPTATLARLPASVPRDLALAVALSLGHTHGRDVRTVEPLLATLTDVADTVRTIIRDPVEAQPTTPHPGTTHPLPAMTRPADRKHLSHRHWRAAIITTMVLGVVLIVTGAVLQFAGLLSP